jgi:dynein heavy chain
MGPPGAGKTECWKTLAASRKKMGQPTKLTDLNPKAISPEELYGFVSLQTREWKDGVLSKTMRELGLEDPSEDKWIMLDGDLDANWIESMNSVMDDNKMLTLASNERVPLKANMRMIFEIRDLVYATPATVSRAGILYISTDKGTQWKSLIESWIQRRDSMGMISDVQADALRGHFMKYVGPVLKWLKQFAKPLVQLEDINMVQTLLNMLDGLFTGSMKTFIDAMSDSVDSETTEDELSLQLEPSFVFCCIWSFGSCLALKDGEDYRKIFSDYWKSEWTSVKVPSRETVFDYWLNPETNAFDPWKESPFFFAITYDPDTPMSTVTVPTPETASIFHWTDMLVDMNW